MNSNICTRTEELSEFLCCCRGQQAEKPAMTMEMLAEEWLGLMQPRIKETSYIKYKNMTDHYITPWIGGYTLEKLEYLDMENLANLLLRTGSVNRQPLAAKTVSDALAMLNEMLRYAAARYGFTLMTPYRVHLSKKEVDLRVLTEKEQTQLTQYLMRDLSSRNLGILLCLYTGLRIGELCALRWGNICLESSVVKVRQTLQRIQNQAAMEGKRTKIIITAPKSQNAVRDIPLPDFLLPVLREQRRAAGCYLLSGEEEQYVEPRNMQAHFKKVLEEAGIPYVNFHVLRHTFATRCVELGFDIKSLSEILGHANINITLNKYVHPSMSMKRSNMNKFSRWIAQN